MRNNPLRYNDPTGLFSPDELGEIGIDKEDVDWNTWAKLLEADIGDRVTINGTEYHFYHEAQYEYDTGVLKALADNGVFISVQDMMSKNDNGLQGIALERYNPYSFWQFSGKWVGGWHDVIVFHDVYDSWQNLSDHDWERFAQAFGGSMKFTAGVLGVEFFGMAALGGEMSQFTGPLAQWSWGLVVDGLNLISDGEIQLDKMDGLYFPW